MSNSYEIRYLETAQQDLLDIFEYILRDNPDAAAGLLDQIDTTISKLATYPLTGSIPNDERLRRLGYRMLIIGRYLVFYVVIGQIVQIRRVLHGARNYRYLL